MKDVFEVKLLSPDTAEVLLKKRLMLDISITNGIDKQLHALGPNKKFYQLVIANQPYAVDPEMRQAVQHNETGIKQMAIAWVSSDEKANEQQEAVVSKLPLPFPIRFFTTREKALTWFEELRKKDTSS